MKKRIAIVVSLVLASLFVLTACSAAGGIQKNFEKEGYTVEVVKYDDLSEATRKGVEAGMKEEDLKEFKKFKFMNITKDKLPIAMVYIAPSKGKLKDIMDAGQEGTYDKAVEAKTVKGNCALVPLLGVLDPNLVDIFSK